MTAVETEPLASLYTADETAWLERMAEAVLFRDLDSIDFDNLSEYLSDMAKRDRREVESRLAILIAHVLKWQHQPDRRTGSWRVTVEVQRHELDLLLQIRTLRNHAEETIDSAYIAAIRQAVAETGLAANHFPGECPFTIDGLLALEDMSQSEG